ncbi:ATP-binding protein [Butyrivibrio sp. JL13D10]|uniref:hybrid sensor histidine kinase/response regulator n=1 Tax=Butyrivibrio sp. JL13D10 TaxID=3236815 RepID=UPI0038B49252
MIGKFFCNKKLNILMAIIPVMVLLTTGLKGMAQEDSQPIGGGYAISGQLSHVGYTAEIYDSSNGLVTSDAYSILCASDGAMWIGTYSGVFRYDGTTFEKLDTSGGLTSGRGLFEDSRGRIFVGTNDNGVVVVDGEVQTHYTYKDGLVSSSIRSFAEDSEGNVYIGTTSGVAYIDPEGKLKIIDDARINDERVLKLDSDSAGRVYGQTRSGMIFSIDDCKIGEAHTSEELGTDTITSILADPEVDGKVYLITEGNAVYYGDFGARSINMIRATVYALNNLHWISYDCGRVWISSKDGIGYMEDKKHFKLANNLPMTSSIEMQTSDYQGNLWVASSTQGVMKVVANNFFNLSEEAGIRETVTNATCFYKNKLYVGTDYGLYIVDPSDKPVTNDLTKRLKDIKIRCIMADSKGNLWISTDTGGRGLVRVANDGQVNTYTVVNGLPNNEIRSTCELSDGGVAVATNGGIAIIKDDKVVRSISTEDGLKNTIFFTVAEDKEGRLYAGTDGDGIYVIDGENISRIGRDEGLTSDVVTRIKRDDVNDVFWILTSNSIQYMRDGDIRTVSSFPYNNNYDIFTDEDGCAWVLSACGIFKVSIEDMMTDSIRSYRMYNAANGLPFPVTSNSYSAKGPNEKLYVAGRRGVIRANTDHFYEEKSEIRVKLKNMYLGDTRILPDEQGRYVIPPSNDRIQIQASVIDYTMMNPLIRMYLEGSEDTGIILPRSELKALEYTALPYGNYKLHIQILGDNDSDIMEEAIFDIVKKPRFVELFLFRIMVFMVVALLVGFIVYEVMKTTVISRQYREIRQARDEAERANSAKTRFLANISHEIRTPINTIMGMNEMVMREDSTGVPKNYFMSMMNYAFDIRSASESLLGLINDLLDISKIESGKMHLVENEYDIQDTLRSVVNLIRVRSTQKELTFDVVVDEMIPRRLYGDNGKIRQIVVNLLTNAVKYTDRGGFILNVTMLKRENDKCDMCFVVKDTGIGIKQEDMEKLFTAYERLDEEKNSGIQGTGLGLDISRRFAELMGGSITCKSAYGEGSEFTFVVTQKVIDPTPMGLFVEHDDTQLNGPHIPKFIAPDADILVVDDNPMNLTVIKGLLKSTKVFVTTATSGAECLEKIQEIKFNVVFLDHMMPEMDGVETVQEIRKTDTELPVYALTANTSENEEFYKSVGFNGYLGKPIDSVQLEETIMRHLPPEMMERPSGEEFYEEEITTIPEDLKWIYDVPQIDVDEGIKNSGGVGGYLVSLRLFLDTIESNAKVIQDAYDEKNIRLYTIKVHALKSSARIIGAMELSQLAASLEDAGNRDDTRFINNNNARFMSDYLTFKEILAPLNNKEEDDTGKEDISDSELSEAYEALREVIPQMDYDAVEMIIGQLKSFKLPEEDAKKVAELEKMLRNFDWDKMEELI